MAEFIKLGIRLATVTALIAIAFGIYALFTQVQVPAANTALIAQGFGMGRAFISHWFPEAAWMISAVIALFFVRWSIFLLRYGAMGLRWLLSIWR